MSGTLPSSPSFSSLEVSSIQPTFVSRSISGRRQARQTHGQYFKLTAKYPPMTRAQFAPIYAFIMKQRGQYESFQIIPPVVSTGQAPAQSTSPNWEGGESRTDKDIIYSTSGSGTGAKFSYTTNNANPPLLTITAIPTAGSGYAPNDTIIIGDEGNTSNRATLTVLNVGTNGALTHAPSSAFFDDTPTPFYTPPKVKGAGQTGRSVITDSWNMSTLAVKAGDYIKFDHDKVYTVTADVTASGHSHTTILAGGIATIPIEPALVSSPADQSALTLTSVPFTVSFSGRVQEFETGTMGLYEYELDMEEVY